MAAMREDDATEPLIGYPVSFSRPILAYFPASPPRPRHRPCSDTFAWFAFFIFLTLTGAFFLWPRPIDMSVIDLNLGKVYFDVKKGDALIPQVFVDMTVNLWIQARNPNFFGVTYESLTMNILFDGDEIGQVQSHGAELAPLMTSDVNATLVLKGHEITDNVLKLLVHVASGRLPLRTVTGIDGHIDMFLFQLPLKGKVSCNLLINLQDQQILAQECDA